MRSRRRLGAAELPSAPSGVICTPCPRVAPASGSRIAINLIAGPHDSLQDSGEAGIARPHAVSPKRVGQQWTPRTAKAEAHRWEHLCNAIRPVFSPPVLSRTNRTPKSEHSPSSDADLNCFAGTLRHGVLIDLSQR